MEKVVMLIHPTIQPVGVEILKENCRVVMAPDGREETLISYINENQAQAVITRVEPITRKIIESCPSLKIIGMHGVGMDHIDIPAATERGIWVLNVPDANYVSVAEHAMLFVLALSRRLLLADRDVRSGNWALRDKNIPNEIAEKSLLIIGLGRIGREVAAKAQAFRMKVYGFDEYVSREQMEAVGVEKIEDFHQALAMADYVTIHAPLTPETRHMFSTEQFRVMKPSAYLINMARGPLVDGAALCQALQMGEIAGAALDVMEAEPPEQDDPLLACPNLIVTPHTGGDTIEAKLRCSSTLARTVVEALEGKMPYNFVNRRALGL